MRSIRFIALFSLAFGWAFTGLAPIPAQAAGPSVTIEENFADISTAQSVGSDPGQNRFRDKSASDFLAFAQNAAPGRITSTAGYAEGFASQASTITGPTTTTFPAGPLKTIGLSGRATATVKKNNNGVAYVPWSDSEGQLEVEFSTTGPTPFVLAGSLVVSDHPKEDCSHAEVTLTDLSSSAVIANFRASQGEQTGSSPDCDFVAPADVGFLVSNVLQPGTYALDVEYEAGTIDPEIPGQTQVGTARVDLSMQFFEACSISGTSAAETLNGTAADETLCGYGGNDHINGGGGDDLIFAGAGNDVVSGGSGKDDIYGGVGDDRVSGGPAADDLFGERGVDSLAGNDAADRINGGPGRDGLLGGSGADTLRAKDGVKDTVKGGPNRDVAYTDNHLDVVSGVEVVHH
jgi:hypothetical protein